MSILSFKKNNKIKVQSWFLICYGNILRSQVLEQYLRFYSKQMNKNINFYSAGIAKLEEFPNTKELLKEVHQELQKREITSSLKRNPWSKEVEKRITTTDIVLVADNEIKRKVIDRMNNRITKDKVHTFYEIISEGEIDFQDTYDYEKKKQDPKRFQDAFDELDRIARKMLSNH